MKKVREIVLYEDYYSDFYKTLDTKTRKKINYVFGLIMYQDTISDKFLKYMQGTDGLYKIRIRSGNNIYRIFCCFDEGKLIVLFNGFQKKTQKTPKKEIERAEQLKTAYFETKKTNKK